MLYTTISQNFDNIVYALNQDDYNTRIRETTRKESIAAATINTIRTPPRKLIKIKITSVCSELLPKHVAERQLSAAVSNLTKNGVNIIHDDDDSSHFQYSSYGDGLLTATTESSLSPGSSILVFSTSIIGLFKLNTSQKQQLKDLVIDATLRRLTSLEMIE